MADLKRSISYRFASHACFALIFLGGLTVAIRSNALEDVDTIEVSEPGDIFAHQFPPWLTTIPTAWSDPSAANRRDMRDVWECQLTVAENGDVTDAVVMDGPELSREAARQVALALHFKPFEENGRPVKARFHFYIYGQPASYRGPPERKLPLSAPENTSIVLRRTSCLGSCPDYRVEVGRDGVVIYQGFHHVLLTGRHVWTIDPKRVEQLFERFRAADYLNLKGYYQIPAFDLPSYTTRLRAGERSKFVYDYGGSTDFGKTLAFVEFANENPHMPPVVTELEDAIDQVSGSRSMVSGDKMTMSRLRAAQFDFKSKQAVSALTFLALNCRKDLGMQFMHDGTPATSDVDKALKRCERHVKKR